MERRRFVRRRFGDNSRQLVIVLPSLGLVVRLINAGGRFTRIALADIRHADVLDLDFNQELMVARQNAVTNVEKWVSWAWSDSLNDPSDDHVSKYAALRHMVAKIAARRFAGVYDAAQDMD